MLKAMLVLVLILAAACTPLEPAPAAGPTRQDLIVSAVNARATADEAARQSEIYNLQLTSTAAAPIVAITETAAAWSIQSASTAQSGTATAQSIFVAATIAAQSTQQSESATAQSAAATSTAAQTATAGSWTATAITNAAIIEAASQAAQQTAIANNVERDNLQLQRQRWQNQFNAAMPALLMVLAVAMAGMLIFAFVRRERFRPVARDARGDAIPLLDVVDGTVLDLDKAFHAAVGMTRKDVERLPPVTPQLQAPVTERAQLVHLATNGLPGQDVSSRRRQAAEGLVQSQLGPGPDVQIVPADQVGGILRPILDDVAHDSMDAEVIREEEHHA